MNKDLLAVFLGALDAALQLGPVHRQSHRRGRKKKREHNKKTHFAMDER